MRLEGMEALVSGASTDGRGVCAMMGLGAARRWWSGGMVCDGVGGRLQSTQFRYGGFMKINKLNKILVAVMLVIVAVPACQLGERTPTPIPPPTPTPVTEREIYSTIEAVATKQPAKFDGWLENKAKVSFRGNVTNTENGEIQFHLERSQDLFGRYKYIKCKMHDSQDAVNAIVGDTIIVQGRLKTAFNEGKLLGSLLGIRNENVIEIEECVVLPD